MNTNQFPNIKESLRTNDGFPCVALPKRLGTVVAQVLVNLLEGNKLTGMDSVFQQNTTRLSAVVHTLEKNYGWDIERKDVAKGTNDGRVAWVKEYWLSRESIEHALDTLNARDWMVKVKATRIKQRRLADYCKVEADSLNRSRLPMRGMYDSISGITWFRPND